MDGGDESQSSYGSREMYNNDRHDIIKAAQAVNAMNKRRWIEKINQNGITAPLVIKLGIAKEWFKEGLSDKEQKKLLRPTDEVNQKTSTSLKFNKKIFEDEALADDVVIKTNLAMKMVYDSAVLAFQQQHQHGTISNENSWNKNIVTNFQADERNLTGFTVIPEVTQNNGKRADLLIRIKSEKQGTGARAELNKDVYFTIIVELKMYRNENEMNVTNQRLSELKNIYNYVNNDIQNGNIPTVAMLIYNIQRDIGQNDWGTSVHACYWPTAFALQQRYPEINTSGVEPSGVGPSGVGPSGVGPSGVDPSDVRPSEVGPSGGKSHGGGSSSAKLPGGKSSGGKSSGGGNATNKDGEKTGQTANKRSSRSTKEPDRLRTEKNKSRSRSASVGGSKRPKKSSNKQKKYTGGYTNETLTLDPFQYRPHGTTSPHGIVDIFYDLDPTKLRGRLVDKQLIWYHKWHEWFLKNETIDNNSLQDCLEDYVHPDHNMKYQWVLYQNNEPKNVQTMEYSNKWNIGRIFNQTIFTTNGGGMQFRIAFPGWRPQQWGIVEARVYQNQSDTRGGTQTHSQDYNDIDTGEMSQSDKGDRIDSASPGPNATGPAGSFSTQLVIPEGANDVFQNIGVNNENLWEHRDNINDNQWVTGRMYILNDLALRYNDIYYSDKLADEVRDNVDNEKNRILLAENETMKQKVAELEMGQGGGSQAAGGGELQLNQNHELKIKHEQHLKIIREEIDRLKKKVVVMEKIEHKHQEDKHTRDEEINEQNTAIKRLEEKNNELEATRQWEQSVQTENVTTSAKDAQHLQKMLDATRKQMDVWKKKSEAMEDEMQKKNSAHEAMIAENKTAFVAVKQNLQSKEHDLKEKILLEKKQVERLALETRNLESSEKRVQKFENKLESTLLKMGQDQTEHDALARDFAANKTTLEDIQKEEKKARSEIGQLKVSLESSKREFVEQKNAFTTAKDNLDSSGVLLQEKSREIEELKASYKLSVKTLNDTNQQNKADTDRRRLFHEREISTLKQQITSLQTDAGSVEKETSGAMLRNQKIVERLEAVIKDLEQKVSEQGHIFHNKNVVVEQEKKTLTERLQEQVDKNETDLKKIKELEQKLIDIEHIEREKMDQEHDFAYKKVKMEQEKKTLEAKLKKQEEKNKVDLKTIKEFEQKQTNLEHANKSNADDDLVKLLAEADNVRLKKVVSEMQEQVNEANRILSELQAIHAKCSDVVPSSSAESSHGGSTPSGSTPSGSKRKKLGMKMI